ncbi:MAG: DUF2812 domain-containing protein [Clostridia bacterium]|nr:DUF2812 domain-containing protein [Clostridia bacterium]
MGRGFWARREPYDTPEAVPPICGTPCSTHKGGAFMSHTRKRALFPFAAADRDSARLWLNQMAAEGWELEKIGISFFPHARFCRTERADLRYDVDVIPSLQIDLGKEREYEVFLADAGWLSAAQYGNLKIYASAPGTAPSPIQTDPELEDACYRRKVWRPNLIVTLISLSLLALVLLLAVGTDGDVQLYRLFGLNGMLFCAFLWLLAIAFTFFRWCALRWLNWRRPPSPEQAVGRILVRGRCSAAVSILVLLGQIFFSFGAFFPVNAYASAFSSTELQSVNLIAANELYPAVSPSNYGQRTADSFLLKGGYMLQFFENSSGDRVTFYQERLDARTLWLARLALDGSLGVSHTLAGRKAHALEHRPADLGFDESYLAVEEAFSSLLIREGNTVLVLEGAMDFTAPAVLSVIRSHLGGKP